MTVTIAGETTVVAGPLMLDLANGDIVEIILLDTVDPAIGELFEFSNVSP